MRLRNIFITAALILVTSSFVVAQDTGFEPIFDGQTLDGWKGDTDFWKVVDGVITGETTDDNPLKANTFLVYQGGELSDFEFKFKFKISGSEHANSGVQFRCKQEPDGHMIGYQADIDRAGNWMGCLYDEKTPRKLLSLRGQKVTFDKSGERKTETVADAGQIFEKIDVDQWHDYSIKAVGNHLVLSIDDMVTSEVIDYDEKEFDASGLLGLQLHSGPSMKIEFKDLRLKKVNSTDQVDSDDDDSNKNNSEDGFKPIFDGQSLNGWSGDEKLWRIEDGAIVGETTDEGQLKSNQFLAWDQGEVDDFVLRLQFRVSGTPRANSGIQVRSTKLENGALSGYQADIDRSGKFIGIIYSEKTGRGILCKRGEKVTLRSKNDKTAEQINDPAKLLEAIDMDGWNEMEVHAQGKTIVVKINGNVTAEIVDQDAEQFKASGVLGLQIHVGPPMKIEFKDIRLKRLPLSDGLKKIVFIAGKPSHGYGSHEHNAGCLLLAKGLNEAAKTNGLPVLTTVYHNGWPADPTALDNADTVVVYCDGGKRHFLHHEGEAFEKIMREGIGLVCLHYGVEVPKGPSGQRFLNWIGGYFEADWSVNPHWTAKFDSFPDHPVTRNVGPFEINDEWYYHMRFSPEMTRVTPILTAMPPEETLSRPDGPHSGNPAVREAVLKEKKPQHVAWAFVRGDGKGRGFGFTGGHFHNNWKNDNFRKVVLNAIAWTAHLEIPETGIESATPTEADLDANQDYEKPDPSQPKKNKLRKPAKR